MGKKIRLRRAYAMGTQYHFITITDLDGKRQRILKCVFG